MCSILSKKLKLTEGELLLLTHPNDGQSILEALHRKGMELTDAKLAGTGCMRNLTSVKLDGNWNGAKKEFIIKCLTAPQQHTSSCSSAREHVHNETKGALLENAVGGIGPLAQVATDDVSRQVLG